MSVCAFACPRCPPSFPAGFLFASHFTFTLLLIQSRPFPAQPPPLHARLLPFTSCLPPPLPHPPPSPQASPSKSAPGVGTCCLYFKSPSAPDNQPMLYLNGEDDGIVNNCCFPSNVRA